MSDNPHDDTPINGGYMFNPFAASNIAVYYGQHPLSRHQALLSQCQDPNVDIVILASVIKFFGHGGYPEMDTFAGTCTAKSHEMYRKSKLSFCRFVAASIKDCQRLGKKVLMSLGGPDTESTFTSELQAKQLARTLWNLFGGGTEEPDLRPLGPTPLDGFDISNENLDSSHYETFAAALRSEFARDPSKTYYLSAAPRCPRPNVSMPSRFLRLMDFIWVQFYDTPEDSLSAAQFAQDVRHARAINRSGPGNGSLGGVMMWTGETADMNLDENGRDYKEVVKSALLS
ncbi:MAG: hypothetical protein M1817_000209 [Caeruleum heppii]|nr:MAG: hypothetical protein M1817_000209 [Caeruleum heppii]